MGVSYPDNCRAIVAKRKIKLKNGEIMKWYDFFIAKGTHRTFEDAYRLAG